MQTTVRNIYNKKSLSIKTQIRHYIIVIRSLIPYGTETLTINIKNKDLARAEKIILKFVYGPLQEETTSEIYSHLEPTIDSTIARRKLKFHSCIVRMNEQRWIKQIYTLTLNMKTTIHAFTKTLREHLYKYKIMEEQCHNRSNFSKRVQEIRVLVSEERKIKTTGTKFIEERNDKFASQMRA